MHGVSNFIRDSIKEDDIILRIQGELNQNEIENHFKKELEKLREKKKMGGLYFEQSENSGNNLEELNSYLTKLRIQLERLKELLERTQNIDGLTDKIKEEMTQTVDLIEKVESKITEIESTMNGQNISTNPGKNTPKDDFRESLDVTATFTPKEQSEFAKKFEQEEKPSEKPSEKPCEKPSSLSTDLIQ